MKRLSNIRSNFRMLENLIRTMSKGYYADFSEYEVDHTKPDENNDHTKEREGIDFTDPTGGSTEKESKK